MNKAAFPLSAIAVALLAACATEDRATPAPAPVVVVPSAPAVVTAPPAATVPSVVVPTPTALRAGSGRVESITAVPPSAAAGGTARSSTQRLGIKMDDGTVQFVDSDAAGVAIGDRVQITADGHLRRPAP